MSEGKREFHGLFPLLEPVDEAREALKALVKEADKTLKEDSLERMRRAIEHLAEHSERAHILARCAIQLAEAEEPTEVLKATLDEAIRLTRAERGYILMWNDEKKELEPIGIETEEKKYSSDELEICNVIAQKAFDEGKVVMNPDILSEPGLCSSSDTEASRVRSVLVVPLILETRWKKQVLGVVYLDSRAAKHIFVEDDADLMRSFAALAALSLSNVQAAQQLRDSYRETVNALVRALEAKDKYTSGHSERVAEYAVRCARHMGLSEDRIATLRSAALLHDVGKIGIRDSILFKPGRLTKDEYEHIKLHAEISETIVRGLSFLEKELEILAGSQEHYDGSGYPRGTKGDEIPLESYIIQTADAWDAMTSTRVYRIALSPEEAAKELRKFSGSQFHPKVVEAFLEMIEKEGLIKEV